MKQYKLVIRLTLGSVGTADELAASEPFDLLVSWGVPVVVGDIVRLELATLPRAPGGT